MKSVKTNMNGNSAKLKYTKIVLKRLSFRFFLRIFLFISVFAKSFKSISLLGVLICLLHENAFQFLCVCQYGCAYQYEYVYQKHGYLEHLK